MAQLVLTFKFTVEPSGPGGGAPDVGNDPPGGPTPVHGGVAEEGVKEVGGLVEDTSEHGVAANARTERRGD
eukprot:1023267-Lingulodinium_polyedra.AAC.1